MNDDHLKRLRRMLEQVDPTGDAPGLKERLERRVATTEKWALESRGVGGDDLETESALETLDVLRRDKVIGAAQRFDLEAIVMPYHRPVVDIVQDRMKADQLTQKWQHLADASLRSRIEQCLLSIGRIDVPDMPSLSYAGTGFIVGPDLLMTNRHVAQIFAQGIAVLCSILHSPNITLLQALAYDGPLQERRLSWRRRILLAHCGRNAARYLGGSSVWRRNCVSGGWN